ncbi:hypothetical protein ACFL08_02825 [Patescibacteria group bacterium]
MFVFVRKKIKTMVVVVFLFASVFGGGNVCIAENCYEGEFDAGIRYSLSLMSEKAILKLSNENKSDLIPDKFLGTNVSQWDIVKISNFFEFLENEFGMEYVIDVGYQGQSVNNFRIIEIAGLTEDASKVNKENERCARYILTLAMISNKLTSVAARLIDDHRGDTTRSIQRSISRSI